MGDFLQLKLPTMSSKKILHKYFNQNVANYGTKVMVQQTNLFESCYLFLVSMNGGSEFSVHLLHLCTGPLACQTLHVKRPLQLTIVPLQSQQLGKISPERGNIIRFTIIVTSLKFNTT